MPRLNDTAALVATPAEGGVEHTVSVREVANGFMTRTSSFNPRTGKYSCSEEFSKKQPRIQAARVLNGKAGAVGSEGLSDTKRYLGEDV